MSRYARVLLCVLLWQAWLLMYFSYIHKSFCVSETESRAVVGSAFLPLGYAVHSYSDMCAHEHSCICQTLNMKQKSSQFPFLLNLFFFFFTRCLFSLQTIFTSAGLPYSLPVHPPFSSHLSFLSHLFAISELGCFKAVVYAVCVYVSPKPHRAYTNLHSCTYPSTMIYTSAVFRALAHAHTSELALVDPSGGSQCSEFVCHTLALVLCPQCSPSPTWHSVTWHTTAQHRMQYANLTQ